MWELDGPRMTGPIMSLKMPGAWWLTLVRSLAASKGDGLRAEG